MRFRKTERKTMRMEQLSIKSGHGVREGGGEEYCWVLFFFFKEVRQKVMEKSTDRAEEKQKEQTDQVK